MCDGALKWRWVQERAAAAAAAAIIVIASV